MKGPILLGALFLFLPCPSPQDTPQDRTQTRKTRPVDVFKDLDGHWIGTFVGYDQAGNEQYRLRVEQWYKTVDDNTQEVRIKDTLKGGKIITGKGKNIARRRKDGGLELSCEVLKSTGEKVVHAGRLARGPDGDKQLVWYSKGKDRTETFREWVSGSGKKRTYHIHGMGSYGGSLLLMAGSYTRQPD